MTGQMVGAMMAASSGAGKVAGPIVGTLILVAIVAVPIWLFVRYRKAAWVGVVTDKKITSSVDDDLNKTYNHHLVIKKDGAAKAHDHSVGADTYAAFEVGDGIAKKPGKLGLVKA